MELPPPIVVEWREAHSLSRPSLSWIHDHADPDDPNPVVTAIEQLRDEG